MQGAALHPPGNCVPWTPWRPPGVPPSVRVSAHSFGQQGIAEGWWPDPRIQGRAFSRRRLSPGAFGPAHGRGKTREAPPGRAGGRVLQARPGQPRTRGRPRGTRGRPTGESRGTKFLWRVRAAPAGSRISRTERLYRTGRSAICRRPELCPLVTQWVRGSPRWPLVGR
jgi:hypothetical protein